MSPLMTSPKLISVRRQSYGTPDYRILQLMMITLTRTRNSYAM